MWNFLTVEDLYGAGSFGLPADLALRADPQGATLFDEESLPERDRQVCRFCGRTWNVRRWSRYAPEGWVRGLCVSCRLLIEEFFV
jgi:hypothetical protein